MATRHKNLWVNLSNIDDVNYQVGIEMRKSKGKFGRFSSHHELYAVLKEELDEFWDSIKRDDTDPGELLQIIAVATSGLLQICDEVRAEKIGKAL